MIQARTKRVVRNKAWASGVLLAALLAATLLAAKPAHANTYTVNSTNDVGDQSPGNSICDTEPFPVGTRPKCTLRAAIQDANAAVGPDTITVPSGTYPLIIAGSDEDAAFTGDLDVTDDLTMRGAGARATRVVGVSGELPFDDRIFHILPGVSATITGLTIAGGKPNGGFGGGVRSEGDLTLDGVAVKDNTALVGGGIAGVGGKLNLIDSTVSGNSAPAADAGGVIQIGGIANITNTTISGNHAEVNGGVAADDGALMNILNSTIASNTSSRLGGGILTAVTGTTIFAKNTIVAGNTLNNCNSAEFGGTISSRGNNLTSDNSCGFTQPTDKQNTNPLLGPLQDNGGPTDTRALRASSPAVDGGSNADCPPRDQRGVARKDGDGDGTVVCDIGAFEAPTNTRPTITNPKPAPGSSTRARTPSIAATVRDAQTDLAKLNIKLFVDGNRRDFSYDRSTDRLSFTPSSRLAFGKHTVKVVADDSVLSVTKSWSFGVVRG